MSITEAKHNNVQFNDCMVLHLMEDKWGMMEPKEYTEVGSNHSQIQLEIEVGKIQTN